MFTFAGALAIWLLLPREKKFLRSEGMLASTRQMLSHFRNPLLLATYAVGFGVLFNFIADLHLHQLPAGGAALQSVGHAAGRHFRRLSGRRRADALTGWAVGRFGRRNFVIGTTLGWIAGMLLTLMDPLWLILLGLTACAGCGLLCQAVSTSYVAITAKAGRSSAVGLYVTSFYLGGSFGAAAGGIAWVLAAGSPAWPWAS